MAKTLAAVHTHTHTHTSNFIKNKEAQKPLLKLDKQTDYLH